MILLWIFIGFVLGYGLACMLFNLKIRDIYAKHNKDLKKILDHFKEEKK